MEYCAQLCRFDQAWHNSYGMILTLQKTQSCFNAIGHHRKPDRMRLFFNQKLWSSIYRSMYLARTPFLLQTILPGFEWRIATADPVLYLTFDDGPIPELTPWVLEILRRYKAKATFFCVGENVRKHPEIYRQILQDGHTVGNHTYNHLNGWKTADETYLENVQECAHWVQSKLFRPPYGRLRRSQRKELSSQYRLIMWDVLSGDFDPTITPQKCCDNVLSNARPGSIVVLHDNIKAAENLRVVLPAILEHFSGKGYRFDAIPEK